MAKSKNVISVPRPPAEAFNKHRPVSDLLWAQVEYLAAIAKAKIDEERRKIRTEGEASAFISRITEVLHPEGKKKRARSSKAAKRPSRSAKG
jgi:hypothetical protein